MLLFLTQFKCDLLDSNSTLLMVSSFMVVDTECLSDIIFFFSENLTPSELKKLKNKQRKAKLKAELEQQVST